MMHVYFSKKQFFSLLFRFFFVLGLAPAAILAAVPLASPPSKLTSSPSPLVSYKAVYKLSLGASDVDSTVGDVDGTMTVEFKDVCEGWITRQNAAFLVSSQDGSAQEMRWNYATWESKDGRFFVFSMRRFLDDSIEDDIQGFAKIDPQNQEGLAVYKKPYHFTQKFSPRVLFPTAHFIQLLEAAKLGEKLLSCFVFDGNTLEGPSEVNAFIGLPHKLPLQKAQDTAYHFWPIRFAIYGPHNTGEGPDLESAQQVMQNGVTLEHVMDYGEFKVKGTLERYDAFKEGC